MYNIHAVAKRGEGYAPPPTPSLGKGGSGRELMFPFIEIGGIRELSLYKIISCRYCYHSMIETYFLPQENYSFGVGNIS